MNYLDSYRDKLVSKGYLVPEKEQPEFFKKNNITVYNSVNGAKVVNFHLKTKFFNDSRVDIILPTGSFTDPKPKLGLAHFYEHLMFADNGLQHRLEENRLDYNAGTGPVVLKSYIRGIFNPKISTYGVENILKPWIDNFYYPKYISDSKIFNKERTVILNEMHNYYSDLENIVVDKVERILLDKSNFNIRNTLGSPKSLGNIKISDMQSFNSKYVIPKNSIIKVLSSGNSNEGEILSHKILDHVSNIKKGGTKHSFDFTRYSKVNKVKPGESYLIKNAVTKNLVAYGLVWQIKVPFYTVQESCVFELKKILAPILRLSIRDKLGVYSFDYQSTSSYPNNFYIYLFCKDKSGGINNKVSQLTKNVEKELLKLRKDSKKIKSHINLTKEFYKALVYEPEDIVDDVVYGFLRFGMPANSNHFKRINSQVSYDGVVHYLDQLIKTPPITFAVGDIK